MINIANARQTQDAASEIAQSVVVTGEACVAVAADFFNTRTNEPATYRVWRNHYICQRCPHEWADEALVIGDAWCPACDRGTAPYSSESLLEEA